MSKRIKDDELKELACYYNEEGKGNLLLFCKLNDAPVVTLNDAVTV